MNPSAVHSMLSQLRTRGFACVSLHNHNNNPNNQNKQWILNALRLATSHDAASMNEFRFPPLEGQIVYTESKRLAFRALFEVATNCFSGLLMSLRSEHENGGSDGGRGTRSSRGFLEHEEEESMRAIASSKIFAAALDQVRVKDKEGRKFSNSQLLFRRNENEPFGSTDSDSNSHPQPFSQSFFNLFNYDHGSLNGHVDRSLLTVIYSTIPGNNTDSKATNDDTRRSALWVKDNTGKWHNADKVAKPHEAIVMAGEDLERSGIAAKLGLFAAEHAVRVDPAGARMEHSHFRRDPMCGEGVGNRWSAAMILRHEIEEEMFQ